MKKPDQVKAQIDSILSDPNNRLLVKREKKKNTGRNSFSSDSASIFIYQSVGGFGTETVRRFCPPIENYRRWFYGLENKHAERYSISRPFTDLSKSEQKGGTETIHSAISLYFVGMKLIPLDTKYKYYCSEDGKIFREQKQLKGWKHREYKRGRGYGEKTYLRYALLVNVGTKEKPKYKWKYFFGQRLVGMCYHNLLKHPNKIMRHLTSDTFNNHKDYIIPGTHEENQTIDRIEQGTYMNRGGVQDALGKPDDDLPF